jgi:AraC-like DNA-binding protein
MNKPIPPLDDETRYDLARQLLAKSRASMVAIAVTLDYANPGAFTRAFRRWSGQSPSEWRTAGTASTGR